MVIRSILEIYEIFNFNKSPVPEEALCFLVDWGLIAREGDYLCPNGHPMKLTQRKNIDGWTWRCYQEFSIHKKKKKRCDTEVSLRKNTFFERSKLSICQILMFVLMWTENCCLDTIQQTVLINSGQTAVAWNRYCREVVIFGSSQTNLVIGGPNIIVEIDVWQPEKRKFKRGHRVEGQFVFGGVERVGGKCFMLPVPDRSRNTLMPLIEKYIRPGSIIISDAWEAYDSLKEEGYTHFTVNRSVAFVDQESRQHINTIVGLWRHLKSSIPDYNRRKNFFNGYVQKFIFLRWCGVNKTPPFEEFLRFAGAMYSPENRGGGGTEIEMNASEDELEEVSDCESLPLSENEGDS